MGAYTFSSEEILDKSNWDIDPLIFSLKQHILINSISSPRCFHLLKDGRVKGYFACQLEGENWHSPLYAPYSGFQIAYGVKPEIVSEFLEYVENELVDTYSKELLVTNFPEGNVLSESSMINYLLQDRGWESTGNQLHAVGKLENIKKQIKGEYNRKLELSSDLNFQWEKDDNALKAFKFIAHCREAKGQSFPMQEESFLKHLNHLGNAFQIATLRDQDRIAAAMIIIHVNGRLIYDFAHAHDREYDRMSPVISLLLKVIESLKESGIEFIDLGSSSKVGGPNYSLLDFKRNLGATFLRKISWKKRL